MCGIVGYIGDREAVPILMRGLKKLEYRGYDSAGIGMIEDGELIRKRAVGKIKKLDEQVNSEDFTSSTSISHTRWATHGSVTKENTHPHTALGGDLALVHNGIIENYRELKEELPGEIEFESETDSEVLAHLIGQKYEGNLKEAVEQALGEVVGTYGIVVMHKDHSDKLITARKGSPIVIGVGEGDEYFIASDTTPLISYTKECIFLDDDELAEITQEEVDIYSLDSGSIDKDVTEIDWDEEQAEKSGYPHFMLKEIHDQADVFMDAIRGRYNLDDGMAHLGGLNMTEDEMRSVERIIFLACGTSSYAAEVGAWAIERLAGIPAEVEIASEFRYKDPIINQNTLVFAVSQSGETADTLAAMREAKRRGAHIRGIVNVVGSTIARENDGGSYIHAGPELAVASTKAYTNAIAIMILYAIHFGRLKDVSVATGRRVLKALEEIPDKMREILDDQENIKRIAEKYKDCDDFLYLGRGVNYPTAKEGSLKLKEITYLHSEAYQGAEMKHGPIALLDENFPVVGVMTKDQLYDKMKNNIEEVKARGAPIILVATEGDKKAKKLADDVMYVPDTMELLEPLLNTVPLQLLAYHMAVALDRDVDRPRNLAKSVTVE
ncbi:MAG: glutamine--fructose-6-phosphate transaminase (isomerizing) [Candidatus Magasanikbacteria bacterium]